MKSARPSGIQALPATPRRALTVQNARRGALKPSCQCPAGRPPFFAFAKATNYGGPSDDDLFAPPSSTDNPRTRIYRRPTTCPILLAQPAGLVCEHASRAAFHELVSALRFRNQAAWRKNTRLGYRRLWRWSKSFPCRIDAPLLRLVTAAC